MAIEYRRKRIFAASKLRKHVTAGAHSAVLGLCTTRWSSVWIRAWGAAGTASRKQNKNIETMEAFHLVNVSFSKDVRHN